MLEYSINGISTRVFAANPNNKGSFGTSTASDENTEYGSAVGYSNDQYRAQIGYMTRPIRTADGSNMDSRSLFDATLGTTLGAFTFDVEYAIINDLNKNTLTPTNDQDHENPGTGLFALATYKFREKWLVGLRFEPRP